MITHTKQLTVAMVTGALVLSSALGAPAHAALPNFGQIEHVSRTSSTIANNDSVRSAVSANGRFVAFDSSASNLVPGDTNGYRDVFVKDLATGSIERVSVSSAGVQSNRGNFDPDISADGRYVTFSSTSSNLDPAGSTFLERVYVRDRQTGTTIIASTNAAGFLADGGASEASISSDGRTVVFASMSSNLIPGYSSTRHIFAKDLSTGSLTAVSRSAGGVAGNGPSYNPAVNADGTVIAFVTEATNLVPGVTTATQDAYVRDIAANTTTRVNLGAGDVQPNDFTRSVSLSANGRIVAFDSVATNLGLGPTGGQFAVYVRNLDSGTVTLVSHFAGAGLPTGGSDNPSLSASGSLLTFDSDSNHLSATDTNGMTDVYMADLGSGAVTRVSVTEAGAQLSGQAIGATLSADGRFVSFTSNATNLPGGGTGTAHTYLRKVRGDAPRFTTQPSSVASRVGRTVTLRAAAAGDPAPSLQWQRRKNSSSLWVNIAGATSTALRLANLKRSQHGTQYRLTAANAAGLVTSRVATLKVAKIKTKARVAVSPKRARKGATVRATIRVTAADKKRVTGKVRVFVGKKRVKVRVGKKRVSTVTLRAKHKGKIRVTLPRLAKGTKKVRIVYLGNASYAKATSKRVSVRVR